MAVSESFARFVEEQLSGFDGATFKKMFGGIGIFREGTMFAMISAEERFYFRTDAKTAGKFEAKGMEPFDHPKRGKGMPYHEVPPEVLENRDLMTVWANDAYETALRNKKK